MDMIVLAAVGVSLVVLALRLVSRFARRKVSAASGIRAREDGRGNSAFVRCPLCDTPLAQGERLASKIFRPMDTPDQRMIVMGCPHCYPVPERGLARTCPVCRRPVPNDGHLVARLFNHRNNKKHVIVTGCSEEKKIGH